MSTPRRKVFAVPNLERDRKEAKRLRAAVAAGDRAAARRAVDSHPALARASPEEVLASRFNLRDALLVIAREYGLESWSAWKEYARAAARRTLFERALAAVEPGAAEERETGEPRRGAQGLAPGAPPW